MLRNGLVEVELEVEEFFDDFWGGLVFDGDFERGLIVEIFAFGVDVIGGEEFFDIVGVVEDDCSLNGQLTIAGGFFDVNTGVGDEHGEDIIVLGLKGDMEKGLA